MSKNSKAFLQPIIELLKKLNSSNKYKEYFKNVDNQDINTSVSENILSSHTGQSDSPISKMFLMKPSEHEAMMEEFSKVLYQVNNGELVEAFINAPDKKSKATILNSFLYYTDFDELLKDWDITPTKNIESSFITYNNVEERKHINAEDIEILERNSKKFQILKKDYMFLANGKQEWNKGKKIIALMYPTTKIAHFYYDDAILISPSVAQKEYGIQNKLDIIDKKENTVNTGKLYAYIATHNYSDLIMYQYDASRWAVKGVKNGKSYSVGGEAIFTNEEADLIVTALLRDIQENPSTQKFWTWGTVHMKSFTNYNDDTNIPIGEKTFRIDMIRQYKSSIRKASLRFPRRIDIRHLNTGASARKLKDMGYFSEDLRIFDLALRKGNKINIGGIIFAGPPSSAKSTGMYAMFDDLYEKNGSEVVTIDTMVEYEKNGFSQISLDDIKNAETDEVIDFSTVVENLLKQFCEAIIVGEVRGPEQIKAFIDAMSRGRLVAGSLHTNDVLSIFLVLHRIGLEPFEYLPVLNLLIHHELVPNVCPYCKGKGSIKEIGSNSEKQCNECYGAGSNDRVLIYEYAYLIPGRVPLDCNPIKDFQKLVKEGSIIFKSREEVARKRFENGEINQDIYESITGKHYEEIRKIRENDKNS